ncbi:MAG: response regulator [Candidatus Eisenbacteria bacterium]|uniref:Response regulator n=1 Tax=Eiseniibacteriota bacterium TaxID=2212470 RepID=A0A849SQR4_UNCEI|nr:response regulator [Candidatus Eisenbacteria bacterium]
MIRVLVVDDEENNLDLVERLFHGRFQVRRASSGLEGLALVSREPFDIALIDFMMPGTNGIEFLVEARRRAPELPAIMVTGYGDMPELLSAHQSELCAAIVWKPWTVEELGELVEKHALREPRTGTGG